MDDVTAIAASIIQNTVSSSATTTNSFVSKYLSIFTNLALISAIIAFSIAQLIKFFLIRYQESRWDVKQLIGSGGMPSSHSATVTALAVAVGFEDGFGGTSFATAMIFACVVMHDALGVRLHAGRQAEVLNQIVFQLPADHPLSEARPLRELIGHTPVQVLAGLILGLVTSVISCLVKAAVTQAW
ncbi:uncharacterized protein LOC113302767 [Papaver somniferum]|uniref:uncharacterized protein LOC113302767 n=1 Tax=Papaver somniferum TaxID=3469 RepID=UPI000E6F905F|nr:uncharacterized protein LOC113302767 [Papaver somniferum]